MAVPAKANTRPAAATDNSPRNETSGRPVRTAGRAKPRLSVVGSERATAARSLPQWAMTALEASRRAVLLCDADWTVVYANKISMETLELMEPNLHRWNDSWKSFRADEVVGGGLDFLFNDEPLEFRRATDPRNFPYQRLLRTGPCVCDVQITGINDTQGELVGYVVDWERVTEKIASERRIKQLLTVLENAATNTFLCDLNWNIVYANKRSFEVLEFMEPNLHKHDPRWQSFRASEIMGKNLDWLFTDEPDEFLKAGVLRNHPYHKVIKTGPCICDVYITGTYDDDGTHLGYAVSWERITDRVASEKRQAQLFAALNGASANVMVTDTNLKVIYMNDALAKSLRAWEPELQKLYGAGFRADELIGRCIDDFHKNPQHQRRMLANESIFPLQTQIELGMFMIDLSVNAIRSEKGEIIAYCTEWLDITERLRVEDEYKSGVKTISDRMEFLRAACSTDLATAMEALANGDLTVDIVPRTPLLDIPTQPDLALMAETFNNLRNQTVKSVEAYNRAKEALSELIAQTRKTSDDIAAAADEMVAGNEDLSQRTEEQASSLEETAASMEEMTSTVKQNADNARQANQLAAQAREVAEKGGSVVSNAVTSMAEINIASKKIADIISVIDEIAFQTNLLALNAAVEAARVGEQGRGFAVVAAEVRNLAGRSATAAKEIKALVQDSVAKVAEGSALVNQSGQTLDEIVSSVKKVADIIAEITAASQEQAAGIEQVNKAVMQMDQITQQNAALVEEATATSQAMSQQAESLQNVVGRFQLTESYLSALHQEPPARKMEPPAGSRPSRSRTPMPAAQTHRLASPRRSFREDDGGFEEF